MDVDEAIQPPPQHHHHHDDTRTLEAFVQSAIEQGLLMTVGEEEEEALPPQTVNVVQRVVHPRRHLPTHHHSGDGGNDEDETVYTCVSASEVTYETSANELWARGSFYPPRQNINSAEVVTSSSSSPEGSSSSDVLEMIGLVEPPKTTRTTTTTSTTTKPRLLTSLLDQQQDDSIEKDEKTMDSSESSSSDVLEMIGLRPLKTTTTTKKNRLLTTVLEQQGDIESEKAIEKSNRFAGEDKQLMMEKKVIMNHRPKPEDCKDSSKKGEEMMVIKGAHHVLPNEQQTKQKEQTKTQEAKNPSEHSSDNNITLAIGVGTGHSSDGGGNLSVTESPQQGDRLSTDLAAWGEIEEKFTQTNETNNNSLLTAMAAPPTRHGVTASRQSSVPSNQNTPGSSSVAENEMLLEDDNHSNAHNHGMVPPAMGPPTTPGGARSGTSSQSDVLMDGPSSNPTGVFTTNDTTSWTDYQLDPSFNPSRLPSVPGAFSATPSRPTDFQMDDDDADDRSASYQSLSIVDETEESLVKATPLSDEEDEFGNDAFFPVAIPEAERKKEAAASRKCLLFKVSLLTVAFIFAMAIVVGGVCGAGLCSNDQSTISVATSAPTSYRSTLSLEFESKLRNVFGSDYLDDGHDLFDVRWKALEWILLEDPMQLELEAPNLIQRYILVLFYFQTTLYHPWTNCNPPAGPEGPRTCYYITGYISEGQTIHESKFPDPTWLSDTHECLWAMVKCGGGGDRNVTQLLLTHNGLNGPIPGTELAKLTHLRELWLDSHDLSGEIPVQFAELTLLESLRVSRNEKIGGQIPPVLFALPHLQSLHIGKNSLTGTIPSSIESFAGQHLHLHQNFLSGPLPLELYNLTNLNFLLLKDNQFTGPIATEIGKMTALRWIYLQNTLLSGTIPSEIAWASSLVDLQLGNTEMSGSLPEELYTGLPLLTYLAIGKCSFSGTISPSIGLLSKLQQVNLEENQLHGSLPVEMSALTALSDLSIKSNKFTGTVSSKICASLNALVDFAADCTPDQDTGIPAIHCDCCSECCGSKTGICREV